MQKIYALDDELHIRELLEYNLTQAGFEVKTFERGSDLEDMLQTEQCDLILLDIMLPGENGVEICKKIKSNPQWKEIPVLFLTAKSEEVDKVLGLEIGADDYIAKPFGIRELEARIRAVLRRISPHKEENKETIAAFDLVMDVPRHVVQKDGKDLILTYKEFELLRILMENQGRVLTRDLLLNKVWGYDYYGESRTIDVHIRNLRKILGGGEEDYILTVRGVGYKFKE